MGVLETMNAVLGDPQAVVFVSDRAGAALRRRERCLKLAGIGHEIQAERRPSGTYYKLCVSESNAVAAHLALQMGGCGRSLRLRETEPTVRSAVRDVIRTFWDEAVLLWSRVVEITRWVAPRLLTGPRPSTPTS